jgi:O-antigen/teichoic acid export membrane protein
MPKFRTNIIFVYGVNILNGFLGLLFVPLMLKMLGAEGYGLFSIFGALTSFIILIDLGIGRNLQRLLASESDTHKQQVHLQNALGIYLGLALLLATLLPALLIVIPGYIFPVSPGNLFALRWIISFSILDYILGIPVVMRQIFCAANEKFQQHSACVFVSGITRYTLILIGILVFASPAATAGLVVSRRLVDFITTRWLMGELPDGAWHPRFSYREIKQIFKHSAGISIGQTLQSTVISIGSILVNRFYGLEGLGQYRAAFDLSSKIWFISNGMGLVLYPKFVRHLSAVKISNSFLLKTYYLANISWAGFNLVSVVGTLLSFSLFKIIKIEDPLIGNLFVLLLLGICLNAHANLGYELLQAATKYRVIWCTSAVSLITLVVCFYSTVPAYGIYAIGIAWIVSQGVYSALSDTMAFTVLTFSKNTTMKMLIYKIFTLVPPLIMIAIYFGALPQVNEAFPLLGAALILVVTVKASKSRLQALEIREDV